MNLNNSTIYIFIILVWDILYNFIVLEPSHPI